MSPSFVPVGGGAWLDGRLALVHPEGAWMAVADLHYGFEWTQRSRGALIPLYGMDSVESRLIDLVNAHRPDRLILLGDLVHSGSTVAELKACLERLAELGPEVIPLAGNHDRRFFRQTPLRETHCEEGFVFHHGDQPLPAEYEGEPQLIRVSGHLHPAVMIRDGAGTRIRLPAFLQREQDWILPAFSPWAAGGLVEADPLHRLWGCHPSRVVKLG